MDSLHNKKIVLIVTGSIAAYKSAVLVRQMIKAGAEVQVIMTPASTEFISQLTLSTLSRKQAFLDMMDHGQWNSHVEFGLWADAILVAPATANTIAKMANGIADNLALCVYLSAKCPVIVAPAMDLDMWKHPATQKNIETLKQYQNEIIPVGEGELASGLSGEGRMAEPEDIISWMQSYFEKKKADLKGRKVLITAGPTHERIDPVRFIGNHSSGKMGLAIARECIARGADVHLVIGPVNLTIPEGIQVSHVVSAEEMAREVFKVKDGADIIIFAAAVADYTPETIAEKKIKKKEDSWHLQLKKTIDIAGQVGADKKAGQILVGFALETDNEISHALDKLQKKRLDLIVLNSLNDAGAGFKHDTNKITILHSQNNKIEHFELKTKSQVAQDIVDRISQLTLAAG
jgi:phosphopantothenoylcysteine decarboxylase/phosphopantothenate--cysteine ligase